MYTLVIILVSKANLSNHWAAIYTPLLLFSVYRCNTDMKHFLIFVLTRTDSYLVVIIACPVCVFPIIGSARIANQWVSATRRILEQCCLQPFWHWERTFDRSRVLLVSQTASSAVKKKKTEIEGENVCTVRVSQKISKLLIFSTFYFPNLYWLVNRNVLRWNTKFKNSYL